MDKGLCLSKEHDGIRSDSDGKVSSLIFKEYSQENLPDFCGILWEFWLKVNGEDLSEPSEFSHLAGHTLSKAEAKVYHFEYERCKIQLAIENDEIVGFLVYHLAYNCVLAVEALYIEPKYEKRGLGKGLIESLNKPIKKIFFQTHINIPPERLLNLNKNSKELMRQGDLITWEMDWNHDS